MDAAASAWQRGDAQTCEKSLVQLLGRNPNYRRAQLLLADLYLFNGDADKAIEELTKAVASDPKDPNAQHSLAEALDAAGRHSEALAHYEAATKMEPTNELYALSFKSATGAIVPTTVQATNQNVSRPTNAATATNQPTTQFANPASNIDDWLRPMHFDTAASPPDSTPQLMNVPISVAPISTVPISAGPIDRPIATGSAAAVQRVNNAQASPSSHPAQPVVQAARDVPLPTENIKPAVAEFEPAVVPQIRQNPLDKAVAALASGDNDAAIDAASRGLASRPDEAAQLYRVLGAAHYRRGQYEVAQAALAQALSLDKSDALAYFLMGSTLEKLGEHEAAAKHLAEAARLDVRFAR